MDPATVLGLIFAWGALLLSLILEGGAPGDLVLLSPAVLVLGGTLGATCITVSIREILKLPRYVRIGLSGATSDPAPYVHAIVELAKQARADGILGLEKGTERLENKFLRRGIELVVDGVPSELIREVLETEIAAMMQRHRLGSEMMTTAGGFAPTMGIIGTIIGLINVLKSMSEPGRMGPAIAAAFLATLYGVVLANMLFLPIANKLKMRSRQEAALYEMTIEGVLAIQSGDNPRLVELKMLAFLPPELREKIAAKSENSKAVSGGLLVKNRKEAA